jgi:hypothetical protein
LHEPPRQPSISTERTKNFDKQVYGLQVRKFVVIRINTHAEKEASIATVYNLVITELGQTNVVKKTTRTVRGVAYLNEIGLVFLVARCNYPMHFTTQTELWSKVVIQEHGDSKEGVPSLHRRTEHTTLTIVSCLGDSSTKYKNTVGFGERNLTWTRMNRIIMGVWSSVARQQGRRVSLIPN